MAQASSASTTSDILAKLAEPFDPQLVSWRVGATTQDKNRGQALAYLTVRDVQGRLDEVMGPFWQCRHTMTGELVACEIGLLIENHWLWRSSGAGVDNDYEAAKTAYSDAFKRAGAAWSIGRYLYGLSSPWVAIEQRGRGLIIQQSEYAKLRQLLTGPAQRSANATRLGGHYPRVEMRLRGAKTLRALAAIWKAEQRTISTWPTAWQEHITAEKDRCKEQLSAPLTAEERSGLMRDFRDSVAMLNGRDLHQGEQP